MRILLDENLDLRLRRDLPGHTVEPVPLIGWAGIKNGALLIEAQKSFVGVTSFYPVLVLH